MTPNDFLVDYIGLTIDCDETVQVLASAIDTTGDGRISIGAFHTHQVYQQIDTAQSILIKKVAMSQFANI